MDKKEVFQQIIADFIAKPLTGVEHRDIEIPINVPKVISLMGPRRSGKTFVLYGLINHLRGRVPADRMVYINFEDDRLFPLKLEDMDAMLRGYYEMYPANKDATVYFFLDEVQEIANWEKFVRRLDDQENCRIYITGSSSKLLSRELATSLRGRTLPYEVFPLSFKEFLAFNGEMPHAATSKGQAMILNMLKKYLRQGGFPELVFLPENLHNRTINEYIDLMLYRDLAERFSLKNTALAKYLMKYLLANMGNSLSITKAFNDIKSQGYKVAKNTIFDYVSYLEEAFVVFMVNIWSKSVRVQAINPSKIYGVDPAFKYAMNISEDRGKVFENAVFLELRRRGFVPNYFLSPNEVDFYIEEKKWLINACFEYASPKTLERETKSLLQAMDALEINNSTLLTWDNSDTISVNNKTIHVKPLWKFLLNTEI